MTYQNYSDLTSASFAYIRDMPLDILDSVLQKYSALRLFSHVTMI